MRRAAGQPERHETPDPARPDAVNSRFQRVQQASVGVRQQADRHYQRKLTGNAVLTVLT
jgi:hypothetical protein